MLVPIPVRFSNNVQVVAQHLLSNLQPDRTRSIQDCWEKYQSECALEILFYGRLLHYGSTQYSINLGPGTQACSRARTDQLEFLALEPATLCQGDDLDLPPLKTWLSHKVEVQAASRYWQLLDAASRECSIALEEAAVKVLLTELTLKTHWGSLGELLNVLKCSNDQDLQEHRTYVTDESTAKCLAESIVTNGVFRPPHVWGKTMNALRSPAEVARCLAAGIECMELRYFPDLSFWDGSRNKSATWSGHKVKRILLPDESSTAEEARRLTNQVRSALNCAGLVYKSRIDTVLDHGLFPWIPAVLRRLVGDKLTDEEKKVVCAFITCTVMMQNDMYVDFNPLLSLYESMSLNTRQLQLRQVLGKSVLKHLTQRGTTRQVMIYRLHDNIPSSLRLPGKKGTSGAAPIPKPATVSTPIAAGLDDDHDSSDKEEVEELLTPRKSVHAPVRSRQPPWSKEELDILTRAAAPKDSLQSQYERYVSFCRLSKIEDRTFMAYKYQAQRRRRLSLPGRYSAN